jgi:hypothetical protein
LIKYICFFLLLSCSLLNQPKESNEGLIYWDDPASEGMFNRSVKKDFFKLSNHFETQSNRVYCGPTTAAIVLNALRARKAKVIPTDPTVLFSEEKKYLPKNFNPSYPQYTQRNVFDLQYAIGTKTKLEVLGKPIKGQKDFGFQIRQFAKFLKAHKLKVDLHVIDKNSDQKLLKEKIIENLESPEDYVLVNYKRSALGQKGGGHLSPLGAYDKKTDRFLIMDVKADLYAWVWVTSKDLFKSMNTFDTLENRGFMLVSE